MKLEHDWDGLLFHHRTPLQYCYPELSIPSPPTEEDGQIDIGLHGPYSWLEKEVGFYPLFLAVGHEQLAIHMTGYQYQWLKNPPVANFVLFSYREMPPQAVFTDWLIWSNFILNSFPDYKIPQYIKNYLFKYSWPKSKWMREAINDPLSVQSVVPQLDLGKADLVSVRNQKTKIELQKRGFMKPIEVRRIPVNY